jgi:hypothetical protein
MAGKILLRLQLCSLCIRLASNHPAVMIVVVVDLLETTATEPTKHRFKALILSNQVAWNHVLDSMACTQSIGNANRFLKPNSYHTIESFNVFFLLLSLYGVICRCERLCSPSPQLLYTSCCHHSLMMAHRTELDYSLTCIRKR